MPSALLLTLALVLVLGPAGPGATKRGSGTGVSRAGSGAVPAPVARPSGAPGSRSSLTPDLVKVERHVLPNGLVVLLHEDHTVPAKLSKAQYKKYEKSPAQTDYLEFAGRPHLHMVADGWAEVAEAVAGWVAEVVPAPAVA